MSTTGFDHLLLCSITSSSSSFSPTRFKFPANSSPTAEFGIKTIKSLSPYGDDSVEKHICGASYGRRTLAFMPAISLLLPLHNSTDTFGAIAADELFIIQREIKNVMSKGKAAGILRLVFHDAGTFEINENSGGMNGSILYELDRPENTGLKKPIKVLEKAKTEVDMIQPVSWADMIAVGGAEAVSICGGPEIPVRLGRIDSMVPDLEDKLPAESLDVFSLKQCFQRKGFTTQELVALSGAHTLGSKGFGNPNGFDNFYFKILLEKPWLSSAGMTSMIGLPTDRALVDDDECLRWITKYANDENLFFEDFKNAYIKLVNSGVRWRR